MNVYSKCKHVAAINRVPAIADSYNAAEPWALLHNTGRTDRFATFREAREEAVKTYPAIRFNRK